MKQVAVANSTQECAKHPLIGDRDHEDEERFGP